MAKFWDVDNYYFIRGGFLYFSSFYVSVLSPFFWKTALFIGDAGQHKGTSKGTVIM